MTFTVNYPSRAHDHGHLLLNVYYLYEPDRVQSWLFTYLHSMNIDLTPVSPVVCPLFRTKAFELVPIITWLILILILTLRLSNSQQTAIDHRWSWCQLKQLSSTSTKIYWLSSSKTYAILTGFETGRGKCRTTEHESCCHCLVRADRWGNWYYPAYSVRFTIFLEPCGLVISGNTLSR